MTSNYTKRAIFVLLLGISSSIFAQNVGINTTGATPSDNAILDLNTGNAKELGLLIPRVVLGSSLSTFSPPMANAASGEDSGMMVYNCLSTNKPVGYYYWTGSAWALLMDSVNNGLSNAATAVQLGGSNLLHNTSIPLNGYKLTVAGSSDSNTFAATGQVGLGTTSPNSAAALDITSKNLGFLPPRLTSAQITAMPNLAVGLLVYNTTTNCLEINYTATANGWVSISCVPQGTYTATPGQINAWTVPGAVTSITITISGAAGGAGKSTTGGEGVTFTQVFTVTPGDVLKLDPGIAGTSESSYEGGGGGGGFVYDTTSGTLLAVAGGGGGGGYTSGNGSAASLTTAGSNGNGTDGGNAGTGEGGGAGGTDASGDNGAGGAGWLGNGTSGAGSDDGTGGKDHANGLGGGGGYSSGGGGGFGGGGGAGYSGGGGGGGYNGGGGGSGTDGGGGGGGSGYWNGSSFVNPVSATATNAGNGSIIVTY